MDVESILLRLSDSETTSVGRFDSFRSFSRCSIFKDADNNFNGNMVVPVILNIFSTGYFNQFSHCDCNEHQLNVAFVFNNFFCHILCFPFYITSVDVFESLKDIVKVFHSKLLFWNIVNYQYRFVPITI